MKVLVPPECSEIFRIDLAVGKPPTTLPNTSKPQYSSFLEFPILRLDPQILEFRPAESKQPFLILDSESSPLKNNRFSILHFFSIFEFLNIGNIRIRKSWNVQRRARNKTSQPSNKFIFNFRKQFKYGKTHEPSNF